MATIRAMRSLLLLAAVTLAPLAQAQEYARYLGGWQGSFLLYVTQQDTGAQGPPAVYDGSLQIVRRDYPPISDAIHALYPHGTHVPARVRAFIDFLVETFGPKPVWERKLKAKILEK